MTRDDGSPPDSARNRLADLCLALPDVTQEEARPHVGFRVRGRVFAWYLEDHHGDGAVGVTCKVVAPKRLAARLEGA